MKQRSGAKHGPRKMADVMANLIAQRGYAREQGVAVYAEAWQKVVGSSLAAQSQAGNLRRGVLEVIVVNSVVVQELTFQKRQILKTLNSEIPDAKINDLRFRVGSIE